MYIHKYMCMYGWNEKISLKKVKPNSLLIESQKVLYVNGKKIKLLLQKLSTLVIKLYV
jgi:hypothetical protein